MDREQKNGGSGWYLIPNQPHRSCEGELGAAGVGVGGGRKMCLAFLWNVKKSMLDRGQTGQENENVALWTKTWLLPVSHMDVTCLTRWLSVCRQTHLYQWEGQVDHSQVFFRNQSLCETLAGNPVPLLTITAQPRSSQREDVEELCKLS